LYAHFALLNCNLCLSTIKAKTHAFIALQPPYYIYASEHSLYLPDKALLQRKLAEWVKEFEDERRS
jgi:hypothetical protein